MSTWTKQKPVESGWYWYKDGTAKVIVEVEIGTFDSHAFAHCHWAGHNKSTHLRSLDGEWSSQPLTPPEEDI